MKVEHYINSYDRNVNKTVGLGSIMLKKKKTPSCMSASLRYTIFFIPA
jgi:hypothetical protein